MIVNAACPRLEHNHSNLLASAQLPIEHRNSRLDLRRQKMQKSGALERNRVAGPLPEFLLRVSDDVFQIGQVIPNVIAHETDGDEIHRHEIKHENPDHIENYRGRPTEASENHDCHQRRERYEPCQ